MNKPKQRSRIPLPPDAIVKWATIISAVASIIAVILRLA